MYLHAKNEVSMSSGSKVIAWTDRNTHRHTDRHTDRHTHTQTDRQTDRQTDMTENITYPHMWVVISKIAFQYLPAFTVLGGALGSGGCVCLGGVCSLGVYLPLILGGVCSWGGTSLWSVGGLCLLLGGVPPSGPGWGVWWWCIPACNGADPPVNRMTDRCKNITLPQTSFAGGNYVQMLLSRPTYVTEFFLFLFLKPNILGILLCEIIPKTLN